MSSPQSTRSGGAAARSASVSDLKRRAKELGVDIPSNVEKAELISLLDAAESRGSGQAAAASSPLRSTHSGAIPSVSELKARLADLGIEVPHYIVEKKDLLNFVAEAERHKSRKGGAPPRPKTQSMSQWQQPVSPAPQVRFRNHQGEIPPPWYQKESRSNPGNFYFVNADTGETSWQLPQARTAGASPQRREQPPPPPPPPCAPTSSATVAAEQAPPPKAATSPTHPVVPPLAPRGFPQGEGVEVDHTVPLDSSRHDYRDDGFEDAGVGVLAPAEDRRWSRQGVMTARRDEETGTVQGLALAQSLPPEAAEWDPDTTISPLTTGVVVGSHFTWVRGKMIGRGSLGRVFKALDQKSGLILAVKEVPVDVNSEPDQQFVEDLRNEVAIMQELQHPNIVRYLGHDFMDNSFYMYLEHMPGGSLTQALQQFGAFDESLLREYARQILNGLDYLHTRSPPVVHRDIKGPNILVGADCRVKLADFGCAKRTQETMTHTMRGSMHWMAPEVISHERYGRAADIWSYGCVCIEMGTAKVPWGKLDNPMAAVIKIGMSEETPPLPENLSPLGEDFIAQCVRRDASSRPSAGELLMHDFVRESQPPPE